jgi:hypothetical protein
MRPWLRLTLAIAWLLTGWLNVLLMFLSTVEDSGWAIFNFLIVVVCVVLYFHHLRLFNEGE